MLHHAAICTRHGIALTYRHPSECPSHPGLHSGWLQATRVAATLPLRGPFAVGLWWPCSLDGYLDKATVAVNVRGNQGSVEQICSIE